MAIAKVNGVTSLNVSMTNVWVLNKSLVTGTTLCANRVIIYTISGPGSSVGTATDYGLDGPGSNPGGDEIFRPSRPGPGAHSASCKMGTGSKVRPGRAADHSPPSSAAVMKE